MTKTTCTHRTTRNKPSYMKSKMYCTLYTLKDDLAHISTFPLPFAVLYSVLDLCPRSQ